jgi:hypothetical protein
MASAARAETGVEQSGVVRHALGVEYGWGMGAEVKARGWVNALKARRDDGRHFCC